VINCGEDPLHKPATPLTSASSTGTRGAWRGGGRQEWSFESVVPPSDLPPRTAFSSRSWDTGGGRSGTGDFRRPVTYGGWREDGREGTGGDEAAKGRVGDSEKEDSKLLTMLRLHRHVARQSSGMCVDCMCVCV